MKTLDFKHWWQELKQIFLFVRYVFNRFATDGCRNSAAALTYTTLLAVVPFMTVSYAMFSAIPAFSEMGEDIQSLIFKHFVPSTGDVVQKYIVGFAAKARELTTVGIVFLVVTAYMMLTMIEKIFNSIWKVDEKRSGMASFLLYWSILSLGPMLLILGFFLSSYLTSISLFTEAVTVIGAKRFLLSITPWLLSVAAFTLLYAAVPNCRVKLRYAMLGGVVAGLLFELAKQGFTWFVTSFPTYEFVYGALATIPLFLLWVFLSWIIILMGAELVHAMSSYRRVTIHTKHAHLILIVAILNLLWQKQHRGNTLNSRDIDQGIQLFGQDRWYDYMRLLIRAKIIQRTDHGEYLLCRDLHELTLWQISEVLPWPLPNGQVVKVNTNHKENTNSTKKVATKTRTTTRSLLTDIHVASWYTQLQERLVSITNEKQKFLDVSLAELFNEEKNTNSYE